MSTSAARGACASLHERSLLLAAQRHDRRAEEELLRRYQPLLRATVHRFRLPAGVDRDDIAQEARIGFLRAV
jgi:DNA-directed RNA polymerase specialized sigma subunit